MVWVYFNHEKERQAMIKLSPPSFKKLLAGMTNGCKKKLQRIQNKLRGFLDQQHASPNSIVLAPLDGIHPACTHTTCTQSSLEQERVMEQKTLTVTQWTLDDNAGMNKKITVVDVEFYPTYPFIANADDTKPDNSMNYTIAGEDPNLRITHYAPSNRLH